MEEEKVEVAPEEEIEEEEEEEFDEEDEEEPSGWVGGHTL